MGADVCQRHTPYGVGLWGYEPHFRDGGVLWWTALGVKKRLGEAGQISEAFVKCHKYFNLSIQWPKRQGKGFSDRASHIESLGCESVGSLERHRLVWWASNAGRSWWILWLFFHSTNTYRTSALGETYLLSRLLPLLCSHWHCLCLKPRHPCLDLFCRAQRTTT